MGTRSSGGRRCSSKEPGSQHCSWGSPRHREEQRLERHQVPLLCLAAASGSTSHRTASSRAYWREEQLFMAWEGGRKVHGFPVELQFSPSRGEV